MARRVFFSFHFERDIFRVNQVRNSNVVHGVERAGFFDQSEYEEAKQKDQSTIDKMIRDKLTGTTVTVVLIGAETAQRPWVKREIELSLAQRNGLLGIHIHDLDPVKEGQPKVDPRGPAPEVPADVLFPTYDWDGDVERFATAIEAAGKRADAWRNSKS
jgi:hypothetical protein